MTTPEVIAQNEAPTSFTYDVTFRAVPATDKKYASTLAEFQKAGVPFEHVKEINGKAQAGILRTAFSVELPLVDPAALIEHAPDFMQGVVNGLITNTVRKMFVDKLLPIGEFSVDDIITQNTPAKREAAINKEDLAAFGLFTKAVLEKKGVKAGTVATILDMLKGKFASAVCFKHQADSESFPKLLAALLSYANAAESDSAKYVKIVEACTTNYQQWLEEKEVAVEGLDIEGLDL